MGKSVYSLILNDEVVAAIDRLAYKKGISRSNMIEQILADKVAYETPEIRANSIFGEISRIISESSNMRYMEQPSVYMGSIMSALDYRYNPAIKYSVELFPSGDKLGQLKVQLRTQNAVLINLMDDFYSRYELIERSFYNGVATYGREGVKFIRLFDYPSEEISSKGLAKELTAYVYDFDEMLSTYFSLLTRGGDIMKILTEKFINLKSGKIII